MPTTFEGTVINWHTGECNINIYLRTIWRYC